MTRALLLADPARAARRVDPTVPGGRQGTGSAARWLGCLLVLVLTACGGGGGGSPPPDTTLSGFVDGPTTGATVTLSTVAPDGTATPVASTTSGADGQYAFTAAPPAGAVVRIEARGGQTADAFTGRTAPADAVLRAVSVWRGTAARVAVGPYSEVAVRTLAARRGAWTPASVEAANAEIAEAIGVATVLDVGRVDLRVAQDWQALDEDDIAMALFHGTFAALRVELGSGAAPASTDAALESLRTALIEDPLDDASGPAFIAALVRFADVSALPEPAKSVVRSTALYLDPTGLSAGPVEPAMPTGSATGAVFAPLSDAGPWRLGAVPGVAGVGEAAVDAELAFNRRGALAAWRTVSGGQGALRHTARVGEVWGDDEVALGRWHGGLWFEVPPGGGTPRAATLGRDEGRHYLAHRPARDVPAPDCGLRTYSLAAATRPTVTGLAPAVAATGMEGPSNARIQFLGGGAFVAFDVALRMSDGQVVRFGSGADAAPWTSTLRADAAGGYAFGGTLAAAAGTPAPHAALRLRVSGTLAGAGGRKLAVAFETTDTVNRQAWVAAFGSPVGPGGPSAPETPCAGLEPDQPGAPAGSLANGPYLVNVTGWDGLNRLTLSGLLDATFEIDSRLVRAAWPTPGAAPGLEVLAGTSVFDRHGGIVAAIGRVDGPFQLLGSSYVRSLHYAVAQPPAAVPVAGTRGYVLVGASAPTLTLSGGREIGNGRVDAASLEIDFAAAGQNPAYGGVRVSIRGSVLGQPFAVDNVLDANGQPQPGLLYRERATFSAPVDSGTAAPFTSTAEGALSGSTGEHAVLVWSAGVPGGVVQGALYFRAPDN